MPLQIPSLMRVSIVNPDGEPICVDGLALGVVCHATSRNDYRLGPFFTDENGNVELTRDMCEIAISAELASDLMGHSSIATCHPKVTVSIWTGDQVAMAVEGRRTWGLLGREKEVWRSADHLIEKLIASPNGDGILLERRSMTTVDWGSLTDMVEVSLVAQWSR